MKICTIVGARPQFVKAAVICRALAFCNQNNAKGIEHTIIHTGQHFDANMSHVFFAELNIPAPDFHLGIGGGTHGQNTGRMIEAIEAVLLTSQPDYVLVFGDTDSTLAGALAAVKLHIPVAHVEAGLRSFNRRMPEEINRILTDHISSILFTPTDSATRNLSHEGIKGDSVFQAGDVMYDASLYYADKARAESRVLADLKLEPSCYILATIHRAENTDEPSRLIEIFGGLSRSSMPIVLPMHPRLRQRIERFELTIPENVMTIPPVGYVDMVMLELSASMIITDSGGVQKEAYFHRVPCLTLRDETEWVETVQSGWNRLVPADSVKIAEALKADFCPPFEIKKHYGDGNSGQAIVRYIIGR